MRSSLDEGEEMEPIAPEPVDALTVTTLVDNVTRHPAHRRWPRAGALRSRSRPPGDVLRAEHGFSALVTITKGEPDDPRPLRRRDHARRPGREHAPPRDRAGRHRHRRSQPRPLGPHDRDARADGGARPHRAARCSSTPSSGPGGGSRSRAASRSSFRRPAGARSRAPASRSSSSEQPSFLLDGSLLVTGEVDRTTGFERGLPRPPGRSGHGALGARPADPRRPGARRLRPRARARRAHRLRPLRDRSTSSATSERLTGEEHLHAVIGGFHLSGRYFEPIIAPTCDALAEIAPDYLVPTHCTGWRATHAHRRALPGRVHPEQRRHPLRVRRLRAAATIPAQRHSV